MIELRNRLRSLGYDARLVNGDCFDIHQSGAVHYLSRYEAEALANAGTGIDLLAHSERRGLNRWYSFPVSTIEPPPATPGGSERGLIYLLDFNIV